MATIKICKNCHKCVEVKKTISYKGGTEFIEYVCPECDYIDRTSLNYVHYGNDAIMK